MDVDALNGISEGYHLVNDVHELRDEYVHMDPIQNLELASIMFDYRYMVNFDWAFNNAHLRYLWHQCCFHT